MSDSTQTRSETGTKKSGCDSPVRDTCLRVELEIERAGPCVMDEIDGDIVDLEVRFKAGQCRGTLNVRGHDTDGKQTATKQFGTTICDHCPRDVFIKHECVPRYLEVGTGSFLVETYMSDTAAVSSFVEDLRERCARVTVRSITSTEGTEYPEHCTVDLSSLTPKQREAAHTAKERGYYDPDSDIELGDVAESLDISPSALSQRLQRAEANLLRQLSLECDCWKDSSSQD